MIVAAAVKKGNKVYALPAPARHADVLNYMENAMPNVVEPIDGQQGFIDSDKGFVGRKKAANIALREGHITKLMSPPELFSEDLW